MMRRPSPADASEPPAAMRARARGTALVLGLACLAWLPCRAWVPALADADAAGGAVPIARLLFTLAFVIATLYLLAATALLRRGPMRRPMQAAALFLAVLLARQWLGAAHHVVLDVAPLFAGAMLLALAAHRWDDLDATADDAEPDAAVAPASAT
jgi:hypothetical protein